jgi:L-rhamnose mutarotase
MKFVDLIHRIYEKKESYENMEDVVEILNDLFHELKQHNIEMYDKYIDELKSILYHITENEARIIVKNMKPYGEK